MSAKRRSDKSKGREERKRDLSKRKPEKKKHRKSAPGDLIDMTEAIRLVKTTRPTFYRWLRSGKISGMKVGRQWRFTREEIGRFLKGEEPRIALRADIGPLLARLRERLATCGGRAIALSREALVDDGGTREAARLMIEVGLAMEASDLHIAPYLTGESEKRTCAYRCRADGVLQVVAEFDARLLSAMVDQWKALAACDVHERVKPQDGRIMIGLRDTDSSIDVRVSFVPTALGESLTARLLSRDIAPTLSLDFIDYARRDKEKLTDALGKPSGLILLTGPAGIGKTTVVYACINHLAGPDCKVMTVEDPVEFLLPWTLQVPLRPQEGVTSAAAVRSMLRSDPNVLMVGELRDTETLMLALQAALTGHVVLTTLHADDAAAALRRMIEMGAPAFVVGDATNLVISQRLIRKLCPHCSKERSPASSALERAAQRARDGGLDWDALPGNWRAAVGCAKCNSSGFRGRTVIAEALEVTPEVGVALREDSSVEVLRAVAIEQGMTTMAADGVRRAAEGATTLEEVARVLGGL